MRGAYYVAFALLVAASTRTAAEPDQAEPHIAPNDDYMTSGGAFNKMLPRRILQESPDPKDKLTAYASDEERMVNRLSSGNSIAKGLERTIIKAANVLRTNGEDVIANAAKPIKNDNRLRPKLEIKKSKRQRIEPTLSKSSKHKLHSTSNSKKSLVSSASAKGQGRDEPRAIVNIAKKMQHDHRSAPSRSSPTSADVSDGRLEKQLNAQKAIDLDKNKRPDEVKIRNKKQQVIDPTPKNENGQALRAPPTPGESLGSVANNALVASAERIEPKVTVDTATRPVKNTQHDYRSAPLSSSLTSAAIPDGRLNKQLIARKGDKVDENKHPYKVEINLKKRQRIDPKPHNVNGHEVHATSNPRKNAVLVAEDAPEVLAKKLKPNEPTFIINNAVTFLKRHDFHSARSDSFPTSAAAFDGRFNKQLIAQKPFGIDLNKYPDEVEIVSSQRQSIDRAPNNVIGQALHAPPSSGKALLSIANNAPFTSAKRLGTGEPTVTVNNAVRSITEHGDRSAPSASFPTSAAAFDGRLDKELITEKAFKFDLNKHPDEVEFHLVEYPLHLRKGKEKAAHPATVNGGSVPINWRKFAKGPLVRKSDKLTEKVKMVHKAFLQAFSLPFHQYPTETIVMLRLVEWKTSLSPNSIHVIKPLRDLAKAQKLQRLKTLLKSDLKKLLGEEMAARENDEKVLKDAYIVKLVIMYELFYDFCHGNRDLVGNLPKKSIRRDWVLKLST